MVIREIQSRLDFMLNVGLAYLQLNRKADTLSGGEAQRIRLASQLGSQLVGHYMFWMNRLLDYIKRQ